MQQNKMETKGVDLRTRKRKFWRKKETKAFCLNAKCAVYGGEFEEINKRIAENAFLYKMHFFKGTFLPWRNLSWPEPLAASHRLVVQQLLVKCSFAKWVHSRISIKHFWYMERCKKAIRWGLWDLLRTFWGAWEICV